MQTFKSMRVLAGLLLLASASVLPTACGSDDDKETATLTVSPDNLVLGGEAGESETFTITTTAAWKAVPSGEGFTLDKTEGTGDATVRVTAAEGNWDGCLKQLGSIVIAATGVDGVKTVSVSQDEIIPIPPAEVTLVVDFAEGPSVATPALPASSTDALSGRHEYTIAGYTFAIYADAEDSGKFYWTDNSQYYPMDAPYKGLYFSKTGAYVEFPAIAGKALSKIGYVFNNGAGELPEMDITTPGDDFVEYSLEYADDGSGMTYTLLSPAANTHYRLTVINRKNAQVSKFVLTYTAAK